MGNFISNFKTTAELEVFSATTDFETPHVSLTKDNMEVHYYPYVHDYSQDYFTMVVTVGGNVTWSGTSSSNALSYSTDNGTTWSTAGYSITLPVNEGDKILWKGTTTPQTLVGIGKFSGDTDVRYSVEGNAMSLLFGDNFKGQTSLEGKNYAFYLLFSENKNITSSKNLSLPATTLVDYCYCVMFKGCINLTTAPELPATTLASYCYENMFNGCTSLNSIKCLATNIYASNCTNNWVSGVASSGTFTKAASMSSWTTGNKGIPSGWTVQDA